MNWRLIIGVSLLCLAIISVLQHRRIAKLSENNAVLLAERDSTERIISNQQRTFQIFNTLSREAEHDKRRIQQYADTRSQAITQALAGQVCADEFVPDGAAMPLLDYANRLRADSVHSPASELNRTDGNTYAAGRDSQ
ncbi:hypothetical protein RC86_03690 [Pectobacterium brasiliense]|uniref:hypothetical protein n=1 Tax=Pectobacterium brasiliense TaxID=180957 RepID=UPI00057F4A95|nr:hypothetical protein [Pectobacterium brasiliense]KHS93252.1 hypothetical protein RC86_03690 [Pectobacterium brasiliense]